MLIEKVRKVLPLSYGQLSPEDRADFAREARFINLYRARLFAFIVALQQASMLYFDIASRNAGLWDQTPGYRHLCFMHITISISFGLYWLLTFVKRPQTPSETGSWHGFLVLLFAFIGLLLPAAVSIVDQEIHGQITVYTIAAFWVSAALSLGHVSSFVLYFITCSALLFGINAVQHDPLILRGHINNAPLLTFLAWALSRVIFASRVRKFVDGRTIERQKDALAGEKIRLEEAVKKATRSLEESETKFRTLAETTAAAIFIHQGQKLLYANSAGETMTGYSRDELLQKDFWELIHPDYQQVVKERGRNRIRGERLPGEYEFKLIRKDGRDIWIAMTAGVIEYGGEPAIIATLFDITERKRAEEAERKLHKASVKLYEQRIEEEKRHRMEKEKIIMELHDGIGGITTNISMLSELALQAKDRETSLRMLSSIVLLSKEGIGEIRSFMHSLDSKELKWRTLATELRKQGAVMLKDHNMNFALEAQIEDIDEQPGSLTWVNLFKIYKESLTNVIKHAHGTSVRIIFRVNPKIVQLTIRDNGVGFKVNENGGRGLLHMRRRAQDIGGSVEISNENGTTVHFSLPLPLKYPATRI